MKLQRYEDISMFRADVLDILLKKEAENNLFISLINDNVTVYESNLMLATVSNHNEIVLTALCIKPLNLMLYETNNNYGDDALLLLARELRQIHYIPPGVMAERGLARRFARIFTYDGDSTARLHLSLAVMQLDRLVEYQKASGYCRTLEEHDMSYAPYWEHAFSEECHTHVFTIDEAIGRIRTRLRKNTHFIWIDGVPVSQAVYGRSTPNGAVINHVYTPPQYRSKGYAKSVVAELSSTLLNHGKSFCCLLADADNPVSCGMYRKLGYYDVGEMEEIRFDICR